MTNQKPIEPLPSHELVTNWHKEAANWSDPGPVHLHIASRAAQWGYEQRGAVNEAEMQKARDEELEACCADIHTLYGQKQADWLRSMRRPKPKSQAEEALETLHSMRIAPVVINGINVNADVMNKYEIIRRALERMRELENGNA